MLITLKSLQRNRRLRRHALTNLPSRYGTAPCSDGACEPYASNSASRYASTETNAVVNLDYKEHANYHFMVLFFGCFENWK